MDWLVFTKFTANNSILETIKVFPFLANYGQHLQIGFKPFSNVPYLAYQALQVAEVNKFIKKIEELQEFLTNKITQAQSVYKAVANKNRTPVLAYQISDFVWLDVRNLNMK